jgi:hypothetical protein
MLKIVLLEGTADTAMLRIEGRVVGPWVEELRRSCDQVLATGAALALDVSEVSFVGREGARLLQSLADRGVTLTNCSAFVVEQLKAVSSC